MNKPTDIDRLIASYFEQPVPELPDRVFDAVRRDIHGTRQRWALGPWREPDARAIGRVLPIAAAFVLLLGLWVLTIPGLGPGRGRPPAPVPTVFQSPLYHYSILVPPGWTATPATARWDGQSQPSLGPNVDEISGPHLIVLGYAGPFGGDLAAFVQDRITADEDYSGPCPWNALQLRQPTTIGGEAGVLLGLNCGARIDQAITVHDGVGYAFTIRDTAFSSTLDPTDFASVQSMLSLVIFPVAPSGSP